MNSRRFKCSPTLTLVLCGWALTSFAACVGPEDVEPYAGDPRHGQSASNNPAPLDPMEDMEGPGTPENLEEPVQDAGQM